MGYNSVADV